MEGGFEKRWGLVVVGISVGVSVGISVGISVGVGVGVEGVGISSVSVFVYFCVVEVEGFVGYVGGSNGKFVISII